MRVSVIHDTSGNIVSLVASPPDSPVAYLEAKAGQRMTEVEAPEIRADQDQEYIHERLTDIMENYRVETDSTLGGLTRKPESSAE